MTRGTSICTKLLSKCEINSRHTSTNADFYVQLSQQLPEKKQWCIKGTDNRDEHISSQNIKNQYH